MAEIRRRSEKYEVKVVEEKEPIIEDNALEEEETSHEGRKKLILFILILLIALLCYSSLVEPKLFSVREYKVESSLVPDSFDGIKIVQFSDIHYGTSINQKELAKIVNKINNLKPDILIFTGDLIDESISPNEGIINEIKEEFKRFDSSLAKYAIYGNEDKDNYVDILESADFKVLNNEATLLYYKGETPIQIVGFNIEDSNPDYNILNDSIDDISTFGLYKIVLVHEPDSIDKFINYDPNLVMAGHTMGGLINLPLLNTLFVDNSKHNNKYERINNTDLYVSNGLGTPGLTSRLNNIPSVNLYRVYKINEETTS